MRSRAQTAGLVVQRGPAALFCASVTGGDGARSGCDSSRAHTTGLVVQRAHGALAPATGAGATAGARAAFCAASRAQTAGFVLQLGAASPIDGTSQTPTPNAAAGSNRVSSERARPLGLTRSGLKSRTFSCI
jgi:hypothetical protein